RCVARTALSQIATSGGMSSGRIGRIIIIFILCKMSSTGVRYRPGARLPSGPVRLAHASAAFNPCMVKAFIVN
ncbi:hypothetical protein NZA98_07740, partial [Escherichia coli]|nr:hypothetical protein [Escherichia coli]